MTAGRVREALIETTGALDVYFENEIEILVGKSGEFAVSEVERVLEESEIEYSKIERSATP